MKRSIVFYVTIYFSTIISAQEIPIDRLSLDEAITYAIRRSPSQNIQKMEVEGARLQWREARLQHIPTLYASGDLRRNLIIPSTPVPAHLFNPDAGENESMYLKFNTEWNSSTGLNLAYDLLSPEKVFGADEKRLQLKIREYDALISEQDLRTEIATAYAGCVLALEQEQLLRNDTTYFAQLLKTSDALYKREKISLTERNDAHKAYNESVVNYLQAEKIARDSKAELLYLMGEEITPENIAILDPEESIPELLEKIEQAFSTAIPTGGLEEMKQNEIVELAAIRVKSASWKYAPTLSLNGYLGTNYYNRRLTLFDTHSWRGYSYIGLSVKVPITQSLQTSNELSRLRFRQQIETENLRDIRNTRAKEKLHEQSQLELRRKSYLLSRENLEMSQQNMKAAQLEFEKGYILQQDLMKEQRALQNAQQSYLQSAYDIITSLLALEKVR
ncbi:TolC family protein [uncultured Proteiniphilum sp.]|uniref:TolC family protein n=1 Tax=uncultured Proteiniphilum sp. TaxID=497637 RepID=UPI002606A6A9|nr:TolC family protein [uncultured Proteiniphilum sp.]